jgi:hypothetical protein
MKFSHSLQFNAVPDWSNHYVAYSNLKKQIYTLETRLNQQNATVDAESSPLLNGAPEDPDKTFTELLDSELEKVCSFYQIKELEIYGEAEHVLKDEEDYEEEQESYEQERENAPPGKKLRSGSIFKHIGFHRPRRLSTTSPSRRSTISEENEDVDSDDEVNETSQLRRKSQDGQRRRQPWESAHDDDLQASADFASSRRRPSTAFDDYNDMSFSALYDEGVSLKKRTVSVYVSLCELRSFIQLNKTGFEKALKKYDKTLDRKLKRAYMDKYVLPSYPFLKNTMNKLSQALERVETAYSRICTKGDLDEAKRELRLHLREHVVWERNTVWREMIGIERKAQAANIGLTQALLGRDTDPNKVRRQGDEMQSLMKEVSTPLGKYNCPAWLVSGPFWVFLGILAIFLALLLVPIMEKPEQQNCLAMVVFVSLLWACEVFTLSSHPLLTLTLVRPFLFLSHLFSYHFLQSPFVSSVAMLAGSDWRRNQQRDMYLPPCGHPSSCFF